MCVSKRMAERETGLGSKTDPATASFAHERQCRFGTSTVGLASAICGAFWITLKFQEETQ